MNSLHVRRHAAGLTVVSCLLLILPAAGRAQVAAPKADSSVIARLEALARPGYSAMWRRDDAEPRRHRQRIAVLISSRDCIGGRDPRFVPALRASLQLLAAEAQRDSATFMATGVALDWEPDSGVAYLRKLADFDQLIVGMNWGNDAVVRLVWQDSTGIPAVPQLIVLERAVGERPRADGRPGMLPFYGPERVVRRFLSANAMAQWAFSMSSDPKSPGLRR